jgi:transcriptional regulator of acetoin/glycerol metabolism
LIGEALRRANGNVPEAAGLLGIARATLYYKVKQYGLSP